MVNRTILVEFDVAGFSAAMEKHAKDCGLSRRAAAREAGVSESAFNNLKLGQHPSAATVCALASWAHIDPRRFLIDNRIRIHG